jgi:soluble lytic murein transglycosylase-like protein
MGEIISILTTTAKMVGIPPGLLIAVCMTETNLQNVDVLNDGGTPSYGVCQVKLETARWMGKVHKKQYIQQFTKDDMRKIRNNAKVAALYLKYQLQRYQDDACKAVAAYNAGSFKESSKYPGIPFNWKYVKKVKDNAPQGSKAQIKLSCLDESAIMVATKD